MKKALGQKLTVDGERTHAALDKEAKDRKVGAWKRFKVFGPVCAGNPSKENGHTR